MIWLFWYASIKIGECEVGELQHKERLAAASAQPGIRARLYWAELSQIFTLSHDRSHVPLLWFKVHQFSWMS